MFQCEDTKNTSIGLKKNGRPTKVKKKKQYTLTMDEELHDEIVSFSEEMGISFSSYVCMAVKTHMQNSKRDEC